MTVHRTDSLDDPPEEIVAAIIIALQSLPRPEQAAPISAWAASAKVATSWQPSDRANLWQLQPRERGWRDG